MAYQGTATGRLRRRLNPSIVRSFRRKEDGSVAVEMGLISLPFFAMLFALIETTIVFFTSVAMEGAMEDAARMVRTGVAHESGMSAEQFKTAVCEKSPLFFDCDQNLIVDVRTFDEFGAVNAADPIDENGDLSNEFQYNIGGAGDVVLVRAFYVWQVVSPIAIGLENMSGGNRLIATSSVFRNEPFGEILPGGA
ncbi:MAG: pilus assembly protein [Rhodobiaceae bacterium]|nr:pilus assembly protein [Rhodobiaceae bacterium]